MPERDSLLDNGVGKLAAAHNDLFPETIQESARTFLLNGEEKLRTLDEEIARVQSFLDGLQVQRRGICLEMGIYRSAITTHRKLPDEVLAELFTHCVEEVAIPRDPIQSPWNLTHVCSKWRRVALDTPRLWKCLNLEYDGFSARDDVGGPGYIWKFERAVEEVLAKSGQSLNSLRFLCKGPSSPHPSKFPASRFSRLKHIEIFGLRTAQASLPLDFLPLLQTAQIRDSKEDEDDDDEPYEYERDLLFVLDAPNIREVVLDIALGKNTGLLRLPLSQLTILRLLDRARLPHRQALTILRHCHCLIECSLSLSNIEDYQDISLFGPPGAVTLPFLTNLYLDNVNSGNWHRTNMSALEYLVLPSVQCFEFRGKPTTWDWLSSIVGGGRLQSLVFGGRVSPPLKDLEEVFKGTPALTSLSLENGSMISSASIFRKICSAELLPRLSTFSCLVANPCIRDDMLEELNLYLDLLESRKLGTNGATPIMKAVLLSRSLAFTQTFRASGRVHRLLQGGTQIDVVEMAD